jgi:acetyl-CoA C-acetyltransferase
MSLRPQHLKPVIGLIRGLSDPIVGLSMGQTAENLAYRFNIDRETMDQYALRSHQRLATAQDQGHLDEIETIYDYRGNFYDQDDGLRRDGSLRQLATLRPVFDRHYGSVTAGNSAQITDGASWLILASETAVTKYDLPVMAKIVDSQWAGLDPSEMGLGPAYAMAPIMKRHRLSTDDIDYWEINEAFAAQVIACLRAWQDDDYCRKYLHSRKAIGTINEEHLNVDGGGVSLGHPVGASGARIILHLAKVLQRTNSQRGIASLCIGGGQGGAILLEREAS